MRDEREKSQIEKKLVAPAAVMRENPIQIEKIKKE